jgi:hypothetical protein
MLGPLLWRCGGSSEMGQTSALALLMAAILLAVGALVRQFVWPCFAVWHWHLLQSPLHSRADSYRDEILRNLPELQRMESADMRTTSVSAEFASRGVTMTKVITQVEPAGFLVHLRPVIELTDDQLFALCQINQELWIERTAEGI